MRSLDEIRALCDAATPGPWEWDGSRGVKAPAMNGELRDDLGVAVHWKPNAQFIAASRTLIPEMADEIEKLRPMEELAKMVRLHSPDLLDEVKQLRADRQRLIVNGHCPLCTDQLHGLWNSDGSPRGIHCPNCGFQEVRNEN